MSSRFSVCHPITAKWEGGKSNHKDDPGGKTNYGVTEAVWHEYCDLKGWPRTPVFSITKTQSEDLFYQRYWLPSGADRLFPGVDMVHYDAGVNSGLGRAKKWLAASIGSNDHSETVKRYCRNRLSFLQTLRIWTTFGKGWSNRVADVEARAVVMALTAMGKASEIKAVASKEAVAASKQAKTNTKVANSAGASGGISGGTTLTDASSDGSIFGLLVFATLIAFIVAFVFYKKREASIARAAAYAGVSA